MKKKSHWMITKYALDGKAGPCKTFWIKLGSVMPDFLLYTYKKGHKYETTSERSIRTLGKLEGKKRWNFLSCYRFGYTLHFLEDYFTLPHNLLFCGRLKDHRRYEKEMQRALVGYLRRNEVQPLFPARFGEWLKAQHAAYLSAAKDAKTDFDYMLQTLETIIARMQEKFRAKRSFA